MDYRPQSPDLSGYVPQSPDLSAPSPRYGHHHSHSRDRFGSIFGNSQFTPQQDYPTSAPLPPAYASQPHSFDMPATTRRMKAEPTDDEYLPNADVQPMMKPEAYLDPKPEYNMNHDAFVDHKVALQDPSIKPEQQDPTLGVVLKTSFPVARIKRIMQADDDIGKVAQVTPHVVSRALELFMIKIISASAAQAAQGPAGGKGPRRILAQHVKKALQADNTFDFLVDIVAKVPDAPVKAKREQTAGSDSDEEAGGKVKRKGRKRKDSGDD